MLYKITNKSKKKIDIVYDKQRISIEPGKFIVVTKTCEIKKAKLDKYSKLDIKEIKNPKKEI